MRGYYNIYSNGELVNHTPNIITDEGRRLILKYLAGNIATLAGAISVGTSGVAPVRSNTKLGFEFSRAVVDVSSPDFVAGRVIYKGTLPTSIGGKIYELGMYPSVDGPMTEFNSRLITGFDAGVEPLTGGLISLTNYRIGAESYAVTAVASGTSTASLTSTRGDFSGFGDDDSFSLSYFINDANTSSIRVRMMTDAVNYYDSVVIPSSVSGYYTAEFLKSAFVATGTPNWNSISAVQFIVTAKAGGSTTVQLDGFRVNDNTIYSDYALLSRGVLQTPETKALGQQLDIEYVLEFNI